MINEYIKDIAEGLKNTIVTDNKGSILTLDDGINQWIEIAHKNMINKRTFMFCGNGASATMAEHISHDCFQNADFLTYTCSETSHITAISNDMGYENVFSYRISKMLNKGDVLITISSSGNSPNVVKAINQALEQDMFVITLSGMKEDNKSRKLGHLNFYVSLNTYGMVESAHAVLLHAWLDLYMDKYKGGRH